MLRPCVPQFVGHPGPIPPGGAVESHGGLVRGQRRPAANGWTHAAGGTVSGLAASAGADSEE
jgi:hypothetical protein